MSDSKKLFSAREAALAVLAKTQEILTKSEVLAKYETEGKKAPSKAKELPAKKQERDYSEYEVKPGNSKDSSGPRLAKQISPSKNPKEEAESNNKPDGMEPRYEFKDKVKKELAKQDMDKAENPDKEADAKLGEKVEHEVEEHMMANKDAEKKEGHKIMKNEKSKFGRCVEGVKENSPEVKSPEAVCVAEGVKPEQQKAEGETEHASIPRLILSAKLSKFMEHKHSKRKNAQAQGAQAVGSPAANAPEQGSTEAGHADPSRPASQPTDGDMDKSGLSPAQIKAKMGKSEMAKHGLSPAQMKAKLKK